MVENELYKVAAKACIDVYSKNTKLDMSTEYNYSIKTINGKRTQVISIAGTGTVFKFSGLVDWFKNINILSWFGVKLSAYLAARRINKDIKFIKSMPILVTGHSLGAGVAIVYKKKFKADFCIVFSPPRVLRPWSDLKMENTTLFIDPDDLVSKLAFISFKHPKCKVLKARENHFFFSVSDHSMEHWINFVNKLPEQDK